MQIKRDKKHNIARYRAELQKRLQDVQNVLGETLAEKSVERVKERIPDLGGWLDIYRDSLRFEKRENKWYVLGEADLELTQIPAQNSLITFSSPNAVAATLASFSPWTVDAIPAIVGGITAEMTVKAASHNEVVTRRFFFSSNEKEIESALRAAGATLLPHERPVINGRIIADLKFLAKRLEYGLGGFTKKAHWLPTVREAKKRQKRADWINEDPEAVNAIKNAMQP